MGNEIATIFASAVFAFGDPRQCCVQALYFKISAGLLRLGHRLVLQRIHTVEATNGLLVKCDDGLRLLTGVRGLRQIVQSGADLFLEIL